MAQKTEYGDGDSEKSGKYELEVDCYVAKRQLMI